MKRADNRKCRLHNIAAAMVTVSSNNNAIVNDAGQQQLKGSQSSAISSRQGVNECDLDARSDRK